MIKAVISDIGNVILLFDHSIMVKGFSEHSKLSLEEIKNRLLWNELDAKYHEGKISTGEFYKAVSKELKLSIKMNEFKRVYSSMFTEVNTELLDAFGKMKGRYRLLMLSDTNDIHAEFFRKNFSFLEIFDDVMFSHKIGLSKRRNPKEIFTEAVKMAGCLPEECVFVDDMETNVKAATGFGMQSILFVSNRDLLRRFKRLGIK